MLTPKTPPHRVSRLWLCQALRGSLSAVSPCGNIKTPPKKSWHTEAQRGVFLRWTKWAKCPRKNALFLKKRSFPNFLGQNGENAVFAYSSKSGVFLTFWGKMRLQKVTNVTYCYFYTLKKVRKTPSLTEKCPVLYQKNFFSKKY